MTKCLTLPEAQKAIRWFLGAMGLKDWSVSAKMAGKPGDEGSLGTCDYNRAWKWAVVWVDITLHKDPHENSLSTLFHELCHVLAADIEYEDQNTGRAEYVWNKLGDLLAAAYRKGAKP